MPNPHRLIGQLGIMLAWLAIAGGLASCQAVPARLPAEATCAQLITPERVGEGVYEQLGLAAKLEQDQFERSESGGYLLCDYGRPGTAERLYAFTLDIRYLFDGATGALVLTDIKGHALYDQPATGPRVETQRCPDCVTAERIGQGVFDRYGIADKLQNDEFVAMPNRGIFACLMGQKVGGLRVNGAELHFQFEWGTSNLVFWRIHWREDLAEPLPPLKISQRDAYAMIPGSTIYDIEPSFISPDDSLLVRFSPDGPAGPDDVYHHPCWIAWVGLGGQDPPSLTVVDAVTGDILPGSPLP